MKNEKNKRLVLALLNGIVEQLDDMDDGIDIQRHRDPVCGVSHALTPLICNLMEVGE